MDRAEEGVTAGLEVLGATHRTLVAGLDRARIKERHTVGPKIGRVDVVDRISGIGVEETGDLAAGLLERPRGELAALVGGSDVSRCGVSRATADSEAKADQADQDCCSCPSRHRFLEY